MPVIVLSVNDAMFSALSDAALQHKMNLQGIIRQQLYAQYSIEPTVVKKTPENRRKAETWRTQTFQFELDPDIKANFDGVRGRNNKQQVAKEYLVKGIPLVLANTQLIPAISIKKYKKKWPRLGVTLPGKLLTILDREACRLGCPMRTLAAAAFQAAMIKG